jgi:hypothetical protein
MVGYVAVRPPRAFKRQLLRLRTNYSRTISESQLLGWAEEDLALVDEEDEMVNGHAENEFDIALDEHIPLKPSPGRRFPTNYGSARAP